MRRRGVPAATALLAAAAVLAGCATGVPVPVAPHAAEPDCASVVLALPDTLADMPRLRTSSQATAAWGEPAAPVTLRCGVEPPGPTTDRCVSVETPDGPSVDWVVPEPAEGEDWVFTSYGRDPAVEVRVPAEVAESRSTSYLDELGPAIARVPATRSCL